MDRETSLIRTSIITIKETSDLHYYYRGKTSLIRTSIISIKDVYLYIQDTYFGHI